MDPSSPFHFYLRFAKPLVLNMPKQRDRLLACAWLRRLIQEEDEKVKGQYLKFLLNVVQSRKMRSIFVKNPSEFDDLPELTDEMINEKAKRDPDGQDVIMDYSGDLLNFISLQQIPDFGVHGYFAMSKEPLATWNRFDRDAFPRSVSKAEGSPVTSLMKQQVYEEPVQTGCGEADSELEEKKQKFAEALYMRANCQKYASLMKPIGLPAVDDDDRIPPTWGSNLIRIKHFNKDFKDLECPDDDNEEDYPIQD